MPDMSHLDKKYFIDHVVFNCPFCNRNNLPYSIKSVVKFDWSKEKPCNIFIAECSSCGKKSMHLSFDVRYEEYDRGTIRRHYAFKDGDIDSKIFYSVPTTFFVLDDRIPKILRELISEADGCMKMNYLTGASACMRKTIYELLIIEKVAQGKYDEQIRSLKTKYPNLDTELFDVLGHIQQMTSDKIHEQSWDKWESKFLKLIIETLKTILYEIYVTPEIKKEKVNTIKKLYENVFSKKDEKIKPQ